jgi:hypothetical protein
MATVYRVEVVSHWLNYTEEQLEKILTEAVKNIERDKGNEIQVRVKERVDTRYIPQPPKPPIGRVIKEGALRLCTNCNSTMSKNGFMGLFGEMLCHNNKCPNSKPRVKKYE